MLDKCPSQEDEAAELPVIGDDSAISAYSCDAVELVNGLGSVGDTSLRTDIFSKFKKQGYSFRSIIHPSAVVSPDCALGEGVQIMAGTVVGTGSKIAANSIINTGTIVDHECDIGRDVHIAPGCTLSGGVHIGKRMSYRYGGNYYSRDFYW